ncbi:hypothetical protein R69927_02732 [Paraburkholderia domus]|jgi:hypothetical protein|uniref:Uncharacterized protein n=1 Tax=Paraburkholderia domus TaxID=2793075 RepID=A0A9N8N031_9BURK|nr:hypothetical protein R70006_03538 [Paraburkholderia domus]CAE6861342.1 hypothetical protein R75471_00208 [Paraburkholderia domus]CAE6862856.1 hypothetical protein R69927_02732 [Paraburkholderia domus]CAE6929626.1 hypothetical protein R70211_05010 [Paraburkholderia domus]
MREGKAGLENPRILAYWVFETGRNAQGRPAGRGARQTLSQSRGLLAASLLVEPFEDFADRRAGETARGQKTRLFSPISSRFGKLAEFLPPHSLGSREFGFAQLRAGFFHQRLVDRVLLQFADDPARAQPR